MVTWIKRTKTKYVFNHEVESMDHILEGVLASSHPDSLKRELIHKIMAQGEAQHPVTDVRNVLQLSMNWILNGTTELQVSSGFKLFSVWAQNNIPALESFFTRELLVSLMTKPCHNQTNLPPFLSDVLTLFQTSGLTKAFQQHLKIMEAKSAVFIQENSNIVCVRYFLEMLIKFREFLPKGDLAARLALPLLRVLAANTIPSDQVLVCQFVKNVSAVAEFLQLIWSQPNTPTSVLIDSLREIFLIISATEGPEPSLCLGAVVRYIPVEVVRNAVKSLVADSNISDAALYNSLQFIIDWLAWPTCRDIDDWIICYLKELAIAKKYSILINISVNKIEQVLEKMQYAPMRKAAFNVLSHMLLSFQHSPVLFHKILGKVSDILSTLTMEGSEASLQCRTHLATLVHCLMFLHTGFPDLYDPILDLIKDVPCPGTQEIQSRLTDSRWCSQQSGGQAPVMPGDIEKSDTGKTGIFNLGNTCYMNSILQTLFMCDEFRRNVLARVPSPQEGLLSHLQQVFAFLLFSQRPAIAPMTFLAASRPSWFTPGQQQDCSEFLKFLLDEMHEQELKVLKEQAVQCGSDASLIGLAAISSPSTRSLQQEGQGSAGFSLVKETFGGKVRTTVMCLSCKQESHNVESFIDIPLAFPQSGTSGLASASSPMSLVGGGGQAPQNQLLRQRLVIKQEESEVASADSGQAVCLSELLNHYLSTERMEGDNKYQCDRCGQLQDGERTNTIVESPQYLILTLLRFAYDAQLQARSKVFQEVIYPRTLAIPVKKNGSPCITAASKCGEHHKTLLGYMPQNLPPGTSPDDCELYGLCSVVVHSGASSDCGHYYCYARHSDIGDVNTVVHSLESMQGAALVQESQSRGDLGDCTKELEVDLLPDKWFMFNDNRVSHASFSSFQQISHRFTKDTPYVLVYKRLDVGNNEASSVVDPPLRADLRETVSKDNIQFLKEQEQTAKAKSAQSQPSSSSFTFWEDPDSDQGPPGSCGGGGLGGFDASGARFVF